MEGEGAAAGAAEVACEVEVEPPRCRPAAAPDSGAAAGDGGGGVSISWDIDVSGAHRRRRSSSRPGPPRNASATAGVHPAHASRCILLCGRVGGFWCRCRSRSRLTQAVGSQCVQIDTGAGRRDVAAPMAPPHQASPLAVSSPASATSFLLSTPLITSGGSRGPGSLAVCRAFGVRSGVGCRTGRTHGGLHIRHAQTAADEAAGAGEAIQHEANPAPCATNALPRH